jgi:hypothetical protein
MLGWEKIKPAATAEAWDLRKGEAQPWTSVEVSHGISKRAGGNQWRDKPVYSRGRKGEDKGDKRNKSSHVGTTILTCPSWILCSPL